MDQVRTSGGATFAPGCMTEDGRVSWPMMQARMGAGRVGATINRRALPSGSSKQAEPGDYAIPEPLQSISAGWVYQALLCLADRDAVLPTMDVLADLCGFQDANCRDKVARGMAWLGSQGFIAQRRSGARRIVRIVATGQILRTPGCPDSEVV